MKEEILEFINSQPKIKQSFKLLGKINPKQFILEDFYSCECKRKPTHNDPNSYWDGAHKWLTYFPTKPGRETDHRFDYINEEILKLFPEGTECWSAGIFKVPPGGYIVPHTDPHYPYEIYIPVQWPEEMYFGWENWGRLDCKDGEIYVFDLMTTHTIINCSDTDRYVYNFLPGTNNQLRNDLLIDLLK